jgi:hypothetical protein
MNMKKFLLSFLTVLFVGVINASEGLDSNDKTKDVDVELLKRDCLQLLTLQQKVRETKEGKILTNALQRNILLNQQFILEYNKCEQMNMCDDLARVFSEYKKSILNVKEAAKAQEQLESSQELKVLISK